MIALLALSALAAEPVLPVDDGASVRTLVWAQPFDLQTAARHTMQAESPLFTEGLLLELRVDPALMVPSQVDDPVLYVGPVPSRKLNWDPATGCAVVLVPGHPDLTTTPLYFGSLELPERVDASRGAQELEAALGAGVRPMAPGVVTAALQPVVSYDDLRDAMATGQARVDACSGTESDRQRGQVPSQ